VEVTLKKREAVLISMVQILTSFVLNFYEH